MVSVVVDDRRIGLQAMTPGWQDLRIPLDDLPTPPSGSAGLVRLELEFGNVQRPKDVLPDTLDGRTLAMACRHLALVPRGAGHPPRPFADGEARQLHMPLGTSVGWPLPANHRVNLQLSNLQLEKNATSCADCDVRIALSSADSRQTLWQGTAKEARSLQLSFDSPAERPGQLILSFGDASDLLTYREAESPILSLGLPSEFLNFDRRPPSQRPPSQPQQRQDEDRPPFIFVYLIDTLRADQLEAYGSRQHLTPAVTAFAEDAVTYEAWSASAWTLPSVVSIMTGTYPTRHGVQRGDARFDGATYSSLAQRLASAGYDTLGISQSLVASHRFGLDHGFQRFYMNNQLNGQTQRSQELRRYLLLDLLHRPQPDRPMFAYLHSVDPHAPYVPRGEDRRLAEEHPGNLDPAEYSPQLFNQHRRTEAQDIAHLRALYQGEVAYADRQFGLFVALLEHLDLYDDSLIVLLSDHGEELAEHDGFDHGRTPFEEMLRVPLMVKYPNGDGAGKVIEQRVSTVDLLPTLLAAAGIEAPTSLDGHVLPRDATEGHGRRLVVANVHPAPRNQVAVHYDVLAVDNLKCIQSHSGVDQFGRPVPPWQAYDLTTDPAEQSPLPMDSPHLDTCRRLSEQWEALQNTVDEMPTLQVTDEATRDKLRSLGYID